MLHNLKNDRGQLLLSGKYDGSYSPDLAEDDADLVAALIGDRRQVEVARYGNAFVRNTLSATPGDDWEEIHGPWLALALANWHPGVISSIMVADQRITEPDWIDYFAERLEMLLKIRSGDITEPQMIEFVRFIIDHRGIRKADATALIAAIFEHPYLLIEIPELNNPDLYSTPAAALMFKALSQRLKADGITGPRLGELWHEVEERSRLGNVSQRTLRAVRDLVEAHQWLVGASPYARDSSHLKVSRIKWEDEDGDED